MKPKPQLSKEYLDYHAVGMVKRLQNAGHTAYLVGGCVRDLLAGHIPKDFDISTSALPQEVKKLLHFSFIIGKRFRLVLVKRDEKQYEVATFRREAHPEEFPEGVPFGEDNIFGSPEQDASRRDFTCNALFYDPVKDEIIDFVDGQKDIQAHRIRMIGDPEKRLKEDPIRILRALRFAHKLHFTLEPQLRQQMQIQGENLKLTAAPRRREEYLKLLRLHDPMAAFRQAYDLELWSHVLCELQGVYQNDEALDVFEEKLQRMESRLRDPSDTTLLFGSLLLAYVRAQFGDKPFEEIPIEPIENFAKKELGLFNSEWAKFHQAMEMQKTLAHPEELLRKGHRRKQAFLNNESFPLAVNLGFIDALLDIDVLDFWDSQLEKLW